VVDNICSTKRRTILFRKALAFDDVLLEPQYSDIASRSDIDLSLDIDTGRSMILPVFAAPMDTIMNAKMATVVYEAGARGVMHRYCTIEQQARVIKDTIAAGAEYEVFAAVGITGDYGERSEELVGAGASGLCIDVAHGHHKAVAATVKMLRRRFPNIHIMAGNVATLSGFDMLASAGATSIRVGVGGGSICSTRLQTGHGIPTLQSVIDCASSEHDALLIADGGIKNSGDIVKALAAGADAAMVGRMLAGTPEAPGDVICKPGEPPLKVYRGMASPEAQVDWRGRYSSNEGVSRAVGLKPPAASVLFEIDKGIRSGLSYSGARSITELQSKARFLIQTPAGVKESSTHIDS
jgi:IMP dehydrogenase